MEAERTRGGAARQQVTCGAEPRGWKGLKHNAGHLKMQHFFV